MNLMCQKPQFAPPSQIQNKMKELANDTHDDDYLYVHFM